MQTGEAKVLKAIQTELHDLTKAVKIIAAELKTTDKNTEEGQQDDTL